MAKRWLCAFNLPGGKYETLDIWTDHYYRHAYSFIANEKMILCGGTFARAVSYAIDLSFNKKARTSLKLNERKLKSKASFHYISSQISLLHFYDYFSILSQLL